MTFATARFDSGLNRWSEHPEAIRQILDWVTKAGFEPNTWSLNEKGGVPFELKEVLGAFAAGKAGVTLRRKKPKLYMNIGTGTLWVEFVKLPLEQVPAFWELSAKLGTLSDAIIGHVQTAPAEDRPESSKQEVTWADESSREIAILNQVHGETFRMREGLYGLAIRNYFGREYVEQLGRERLLSTPGVVVEEEPNDAIRLDLHQRPWECSSDEISDILKTAMAHLRPSGMFSSYELEQDPKSDVVWTNWTPGPNFRRISAYERTHGTSKRKP